MSSESFAALRKTSGDELAGLAEEHFKHDLREEDREIVKSSARKVSTHTFVGSMLGVGLGGFLAYRVRANRKAFYQAFRATEKPTHVKFADGREEAIPDVTSLLQPTTMGDVFTYTFFSIAGLFLGGETGLLTGTWSARRTLEKNSDTKARVEKAWRSFRADVLRKQIEELEGGKKENTLLW
ncbi:hypothetical protein LTR99_010950 [Exophiala xenobiotica]|uniref:Uncharacterized protein n=1 Tax=Vermiconidia calcicola TaxID=1690605 RepID=A0AAV9PSY5_9PEZI|nr:hypothetical protein H2202_010564 [Exophiala xenobiotica]KAK5527936.1 hypothetical protein LTR25_010735 [Vermiconidia calcicola]KAK5529862.1 hypothetical protein LTR23_010601 [Chaetothyriales sp. CCFEE 6169]KAK5190189.1 hypothetical protein LTR92_009900 [Exophiala xenobiotica]KAK5203480.1 hypothetical protein LTR41_010843 [Exophiala xenobiotica]